MSTEHHPSIDPISVPPPGSNETTHTHQSSSIDVEPLHRPEEMAHIEVPHNVENIPHGVSLMNGKTLLAKKMAVAGASFYSPSDALVSPCTQKLSSQKGKRWANAKVKPTVFGKSNLNQSSLNCALDPRSDEPSTTLEKMDPENLDDGGSEPKQGSDTTPDPSIPQDSSSESVQSSDVIPVL